MNFFCVLNHISINEKSVRVIKDQIGYSALKNSLSNASSSYLSHVPNVSLTESKWRREYGELQKPPPRDSLIKTLETIQDSYATCSKNNNNKKKVPSLYKQKTCLSGVDREAPSQKLNSSIFHLLIPDNCRVWTQDKIDMKQPCPLPDARQSIWGQCKQPQ